jgi:hypothetical protein
MLIYGNTPRDMIRIMRSSKWKLIAIVFIVISLLLAYDKFKQPRTPLKALDQFWETLGTGENLTNKVE